MYLEQYFIFTGSKINSGFKGIKCLDISFKVQAGIRAELVKTSKKSFQLKKTQNSFRKKENKIRNYSCSSPFFLLGQLVKDSYLEVGHPRVAGFTPRVFTQLDVPLTGKMVHQHWILLQHCVEDILEKEITTNKQGVPSGIKVYHNTVLN